MATKTKEDTIIERWFKLQDQRQALVKTIAHFRELQAQITFNDDWPIFTQDTEICTYWATGGNGAIYPYLKIRSSEEIFPVRRRIGKDDEGNWIYEDGFGKSKHLGRPGHPVHLSAVQQQILSSQWWMYEQQIRNIQALFPRLDEQIEKLRETVKQYEGSRVPRPYDAVLGGEEAARLRKQKYGY
jgi:hypothetical protein